MLLKNLFLFASTFSIILALMGCRQKNSADQSTLYATISTPISNVNPVYATDAGNQRLNQIVHASLLSVGNDLTPQAELAESFKLIGDRQIDFVLKKNCHFQNGRELSARDVENSWKIYTEENNKSPFRESLARIEKFVIRDDFHFSIFLKEPSPSLLTDLAILKIIPAEEYSAAKFSKNAIGAGPFSIKEFNNREILLETFPGSCITPKPDYNFLKLSVVRDELSIYFKLKTGEIDLSPPDALFYRKVRRVMDGLEPELRASVSDGISYSYLGLNVKDNPLQDIRIRKALALSFNIPELTHFESQDLQVPAATILPPVNFFANRNLKPIGENLEEARSLLDQAGYYNGRNQKPVLRLKFLTAANEFSLKNARILASQAERTGFQFDLRSFEWGSFLADVKAKNTQIYLLRWVGATDPNIYAEAFHSGILGKNNRTNFKNEELDKLFTLAEKTMNLEKRKSYYLKAQEIIYNQLPYISLWHNQNAAVFGKHISNVVIPPNGSWKFFLTVKKGKI